jgi:hypothetical protein
MTRDHPQSRDLNVNARRTESPKPLAPSLRLIRRITDYSTGENVRAAIFPPGAAKRGFLPKRW